MKFGYIVLQAMLLFTMMAYAQDAMSDSTGLASETVPPYLFVRLSAEKAGEGHLRRVLTDCATRPVVLKPTFPFLSGIPTDYEVIPIPYNPPQVPPSTEVTRWEGRIFWSDVVDLPFDFGFYDSVYSQVSIGADGLISFNASKVAGEVVRVINYVDTNGIEIHNPSVSNVDGMMDFFIPGRGYMGEGGNDASNCIYGVFTNNYDQYISYAFIGERPYRKMVVMWDSGVPWGYNPIYVHRHNPFYKNKDYPWETPYWRQVEKEAFCTVLYEGTNIIEVHVGICFGASASLYSDSNFHMAAIIGVQNADCTKGITAPDRGAQDIWSNVDETTWEITPEAWRFVPKYSHPAPHTMRWYRGQGTKGEFLGTGDSLTLPPPNQGNRDTITVQLEMTSPTGDNYLLYDTAEIVWPLRDTLHVHLCNGGFFVTQPTQSSSQGSQNLRRSCDAANNDLQFFSQDPQNLRQSREAVYTLDGQPYVSTDTLLEQGTKRLRQSCDAANNDIQSSMHSPQHLQSNKAAYTLNGKSYTQSGIYVDTLQTRSGCDSIVVLNLTVHQPYRDTLRDTLDHGEPFTWFDSTFYGSGTFIDWQHTVHGCDSVTVNLISRRSRYTSGLVANLSQDGITIEPTLLYPSQSLTITTISPATMQLYDLTGRLIASQDLHAGKNIVPVPTISGIYLVRVVLSDGETAIFRVLVLGL